MLKLCPYLQETISLRVHTSLIVCPNHLEYVFNNISEELKWCSQTNYTLVKNLFTFDIVLIHSLLLVFGTLKNVQFPSSTDTHIFKAFFTKLRLRETNN